MTDPIPPNTTTPSSDEQIVRLTPYPVSNLPSHNFIESDSTPELKSFIQKVLGQAKTLVDELINAKPTWQKAGSKTFSMKSAWTDQQPSVSTTDIEIYKYERSVLEPKGVEYWFARKSVHKPASEAGTANFEEFEYGLKTEHSRHEKDYTPDLLHANQVLEWRKARSLDLDGYSAITLESKSTK
jgi:hypothetical protein